MKRHGFQIRSGITLTLLVGACGNWNLERSLWNNVHLRGLEDLRNRGPEALCLLVCTQTRLQLPKTPLPSSFVSSRLAAALSFKRRHLVPPRGSLVPRLAPSLDFTGGRSGGASAQPPPPLTMRWGGLAGPYPQLWELPGAPKWWRAACQSCLPKRWVQRRLREGTG